MIQPILPSQACNPPAASVALAALGALFLFAVPDPAFAAGNHVSITTSNGQRCIKGNGLPNHKTGRFPNRGNPNAIRAQNVSLCVALNPHKGSTPVDRRGPIGVALNGVQFRPSTAGYYDASSPRGHSRDPSSGWKLEGINPRNMLGMDFNNAHVGRAGLYHYHGVPKGLLRSVRNGLIGYAADGFPIYNAGSRDRSSYRLKSGTRPSGPGGKYDGTYKQDWIYVANAGTLDQCNGKTVNGKYRYYATKAYPYLPRCLWGTVSADFQRAPRHDGAHRVRGLRGPRADRQRTGLRRGPRGRRGPPPRARRVCADKAENTACTFFGRGRNRQVTGTCRITPRGIKACIPEGRGQRGARRRSN